MRILIDGDACPVKDEIIQIGSKYNIDTLFFCSLSHYGNYNDFTKWILVDNEDQAVDMEIFKYLLPGDILITGDYGLASLALNKKTYVVSYSGKKFTKDNIDMYLYQRHLAQEQRKLKVKTTKIKKRQKKDNLDFQKALENLIKTIR